MAGMEFVKKANGKDIDYKMEDESDDWVKESAMFKLNGNTFHASYWRSKKDKPPSSLVILSHGYGEYLNFCYEEAAKSLVEMCGSIVFGHDHQGHGKTTGTRVQVNSIDEYVDPVLAHVEFMKVKYPDIPCFIVGHSMGGLITLHALIKNQDLFSGAVLFGPLVMADPDMATPFRVFLAQTIQGVWPSFSLSEIDASLITRDKEMLERIRKDSLNWHGGFKARHSWVLLQAFTFVQNNMAKLTLPILVLQGEKDKVVAPAGSKMIVDNCSSEDKEYVEYPDAFHHLLVELEVVKSDVVDKIQAFINNHL